MKHSRFFRALTARLPVFLLLGGAWLRGHDPGFWDIRLEACPDDLAQMGRPDSTAHTLRLESELSFSAGCTTCSEDDQGDSMRWRLGAESDEARAIRLHSSVVLSPETCTAIENSAQPAGTVSCKGTLVEVRRPDEAASPVDLLFEGLSISQTWTADWAVTIGGVPNNDNLTFRPELVLDEDVTDSLEYRVVQINPGGGAAVQDTKFRFRVEINDVAGSCPFLSGPEIDQLDVSSPVAGGRAVALVSGPGADGECVVRALFRGNGGSIEIANLAASEDLGNVEAVAAQKSILSSLIASSSSGASCYTEVAAFASGKAAFIGAPSRMSPLGDRETLPSEDRIAIPIKAWVTAQPPSAGNTAVWRREREALLHDQIAYANHVLEQNLAGIVLDLRFPIGFLSPSQASRIGEDCSATSSFWTDEDLFLKEDRRRPPAYHSVSGSQGQGVLNVYTVAGGAGGIGVGGGQTCVSANPNVIFLGGQAPIDVLVHEVGHHLGLSPTVNGGHTNDCLREGGGFRPCDGFGAVNVMWNGYPALLRDQFSIGQIYRMNFYLSSALFANRLRSVYQARMCPPSTEGCFGCPALRTHTYTGVSQEVSQENEATASILPPLQAPSPPDSRGDGALRTTLEIALRRVFDAMEPIPGGSQTVDDFLRRHLL